MAATDDPGAPYPCPACGATLFGWVAAHDPLERSRRIILDRCEDCGLAVTRAPRTPDVEAELAPLIRTDESGGRRIDAPNLKSLQGGLGGAQWAGLEPDRRRLHLTPDALRLLLGKQGLELEGLRTPFTQASFRLMLQTVINAFTLRDNFLRNARAGRFAARRGAWEHFTYGLDWVVSGLVFLPSVIFSLPIEAAGSTLGRGGLLEAQVRERREGAGA